MNPEKLSMRKIAFEEHPWPDVPHLVLTPEDTSPRGCVEALLEATRDLAALFAAHPDIDEDEPWFGWAFQRGDEMASEASVFTEAVAEPDCRPLLDTYVQRVIAFFKETDAEPGFYVHEEKEAASDALRLLVAAEPDAYFERYLEFLQAVDLEHTVAQHGNVTFLAGKLSDEQRERLREVLAATSGGHHFSGL